VGRDGRDFAAAWGPVDVVLREHVPGPPPTIDLVAHRMAWGGTGLRTRGMSAGTMALPAGSRHASRVELTTIVPGGWRFVDDDGAVDEETWWLARTLRWLARCPFRSDVWLGYGNTVQLTPDGVTPIHPSTLFTHVLVLYPLPPPEPVFRHGDRWCGFLLPVFLTTAEAAALRRDGLDALDTFGDPFDYWCQPSRPCSVTGEEPRPRR